MKPEFKILSPTAILGYGFPEESFKRGMAEKPDLIAVDAGSTDPGPYYLGAGKAFTGSTQNVLLTPTPNVRGLPTVTSRP